MLSSQLSKAPLGCHPCLLIHEVLLRIFSTLRPGALAAAALTCRAWADPALDILWMDIDMIHPLQILAPMRLQPDELVRVFFSTSLYDLFKVLSDIFLFAPVELLGGSEGRRVGSFRYYRTQNQKGPSQSRPSRKCGG